MSENGAGVSIAGLYLGSVAHADDMQILVADYISNGKSSSYPGLLDTLQYH